MSNPSALSRKDMREPDRFQVAATQAASWLAAHKRLAGMVAGGAVLLVVAIGVGLALQSRSADSAGRATTELTRLLGAQVATTPPAGSTAKSFPTEEAKNNAILAEADKILAEHGAGQRTLLAVLAKGSAHFALKEWDAAAAAYGSYLAEASQDDSLRFAALENLGIIAEQKGDLAAATQAFERMAKEAPAYADRADLDRARVLKAAGKAEDARQLLTKFAENHPKSTLKQEASQELQRLGAK